MPQRYDLAKPAKQYSPMARARRDFTSTRPPPAARPCCSTASTFSFSCPSFWCSSTGPGTGRKTGSSSRRAASIAAGRTGVFSCRSCLLAAWRSSPRPLIEDAPSATGKKRALAVSVALTLGLLAFFKYSNFAASTFAFLVHPLGWHPPERILSVVLPIGISFYTFQAISYVVDVYRGHVKACRNPRDFLVYITLFPQLISGPIQRAGHLLPQIQRRRLITQSEVAEGLYLVLWGYTKKTVIADNLGLKVDRIFNQGNFTTTSVLIGALGYAFQVYADFSGYTDIARGVARWLGFELSVNFDHPVLRRQPAGILATLAHQPFDMAARLSLHLAWRKPRRSGPHIPKSFSHDAPRRSLARRGVELRALGRLSGRPAGGPSLLDRTFRDEDA